LAQPLGIQFAAHQAQIKVAQQPTVNRFAQRRLRPRKSGVGDATIDQNDFCPDFFGGVHQVAPKFRLRQDEGIGANPLHRPLRERHQVKGQKSESVGIKDALASRFHSRFSDRCDQNPRIGKTAAQSRNDAAGGDNLPDRNGMHPKAR
jgi:hypothetical protein